MTGIFSIRFCDGYVVSDGAPCSAPALWLVAVGTRRTDEQASCGNHLGATCTALLGAENRDGASLTVTPVRAGGAS